MGKFGQVCLVLVLMTASLSAQEWGGPESVGVEVHGPKGHPVSDAKIMLTYSGQSGGIGPPLVATDSKGKAVVSGLVLGQWQIEISHPDYLSYVGILHMRPGKKAAVSTSFLEATGTSLTPVKVKFFNARNDPASQPLPDERPDLPQLAAKPAAPPPTVEEEIAPEVVAEAPQPVVSADQPPSTVTPPVGSYAQSDDESDVDLDSQPVTQSDTQSDAQSDTQSDIQPERSSAAADAAPVQVAASTEPPATTVTPAIDTPVVRSEPPPTEPIVTASPVIESPVAASPVAESPVTESPVPASPVAESPTEDSAQVETPASLEPSPMPVAPPETVPTPEPIEEHVEEPVVVEVSEPVEESPPPLPTVAVPEIAGEPASELDPVDETIEPPVSEPLVSEPPVSETPVSQPPVEEQQSEASLSEELPEVVTEAPVPEPEIDSTTEIEPAPEPQTEPQIEPQIEPVAPIPAEPAHQEAPVQTEVQEMVQAPPPTQPIEPAETPAEQPTIQPVEPIEPADRPIEKPIEKPVSPPVTPTPEETVTEPPSEVPQTEVPPTEVTVQEAAAEPTPTPETAPPTAPPVSSTANVIPAPAAGVVGVGSYRDGSCPDCQTGEWAAATSKVVGADLTGSRCDQELIDATRSAMQGLGESINLELAGYLGPVFSDTGKSASQLVEQDLAEPLRGRLRPHLDGSSACQIVALVVPKAVRYTKTRYFAADRDGSRECAAGTDCGIGSSRWATSAQVEKGHSATVVWALFENKAAGRERRATLSVYFRPSNARWQPRTVGGQ